MKRLIITENDYEQLYMLVTNDSRETEHPEIVKELKVKMLSAITLPKKSVSERVVTMNSRVRLKELGSNRVIDITISFPKDANDHEQKISIFSEVGVALLGKSMGDIVNLSIPGSIGHFEISDVRNQHETSDDYRS